MYIFIQKTIVEAVDQWCAFPFSFLKEITFPGPPPPKKKKTKQTKCCFTDSNEKPKSNKTKSKQGQMT